MITIVMGSSLKRAAVVVEQGEERDCDIQSYEEWNRETLD